MLRHRRSYFATAAFAASLALCFLFALIWLMVEILTAQQPWSPLFILAFCAAGLVLVGGEILAGFVLAGALISLNRDNLEARGVPYVGHPREWHNGFASRCCHVLFRAIRSLEMRRPGQLDLRPGEMVEIRSREEILATLDARGERDSLPFMPEMEAWCGRQARVFRRIDTLSDWITFTGQRRMRDTVVLENLRCDGGGHQGCQADCPILWKEVWLRRASTKRPPAVVSERQPSAGLDLVQFTKRVDTETSESRFVCQLTRVPAASTPTSWHNPRNLLREILSGNVRVSSYLVGTALHLFNSAQRRSAGVKFPFLAPSQTQKTPHAVLDLQPGELVRVKSKREIELTLDARFKNRGLFFDAEMTRFCGGTYRVRARVDRQIDEKSGKFLVFPNPCITLEGCTATGEYSEFAPLDERIYWREIWLERVKD